MTLAAFVWTCHVFKIQSREEVMMSLIDCPRGHQFSDHLPECPYCRHEKLIFSINEIKGNQTKLSTPKSILSTSYSSSSSSSSWSTSSTSSSTPYRPRPFNTALKSISAIIAIVVLIAVGRIFFQNSPKGPKGPIVPVGTCLTLTSSDMVKLPSDWSSKKTPCDQPDAFTKIIKIQSSVESIEECRNTKECFWIRYNNFIYQYNVIPHVGQCFYGYENTAWPDRGTYKLFAWPQGLVQCGMSFPEWVDKSLASTHLEVEEAALRPVQYRIEKLDVACDQEQSNWEVTYSTGTVTAICASITYR